MFRQHILRAERLEKRLDFRDYVYLLNPEHLVVLLAGPISHTTIQYIQYMDFVEIFSIFHWICLLCILLILVDVELPLCIVVTLS